MSQAEPYAVVNRTASGARMGRTFARKRNAQRYAVLHGYNTIVQKKKGRAGFTVVQTVKTRKK